LGKEIQGNPNQIQDNPRRKVLGFPWILFGESGLFNGLRRPFGKNFIAASSARPDRRGMSSSIADSR
jgi:hypothetical protein